MSTSTFHIAVKDQENKESITAPKGTINSARKPLGERGINQTPAKPMKLAPQKITVFKNTPKIGTPQPCKVIPNWYTDICSYKPVKDPYDDFIWPKSERINVSGFMSTMLEPKTPPFKHDFTFIPKIFESSPRNDSYYMDRIGEVDLLDMEMLALDF